jgi:iron complex transport system substrate-binding protein
MTVTRRTVLGFAGALFVAPALRSAHAASTRFAVIDWAMLETALAIGAVPAAASELRQYRQMQLEPAVPESVADLGLRGAPNLELLRMIEPDLSVQP